MCKKLARSRSVFARGLIVITITIVCGCGLVDSVGPRAVHYNDEVADSKTGAILLNIIRAAYSVPLQFTDLTQFTAGATAEGNIGAETGAGIPVPLNHLSNLQPRTGNVSPQISLGGRLNATTSTTGVNLNNQEFYQGLQTPLEKKQIHYYLTGNATSLEDWQLLSLFISSIIVYDNTVKPKYAKRLYGRADNIDNFEAFTLSIEELVRKGLTMQRKKPAKKPVGPCLFASEAAHPELLAALVNSSIAERSGLTLVEVEDREGAKPNGKCKGIEGDGPLYQLQGTGKEVFDFCFAPQETTANRNLSTEFRTQLQRSEPVALFGTTRQAPLVRTTIAEETKCGEKEPEKDAGIKFETRSLEGIITFLGEMVRTELGLGIDSKPTSLAYFNEEWSCDYSLFSVKPRRPSSGEIGVKYQGQWFSVAVDPTGQCDSSSRVLQVLADLWALQSKAKDFPVSIVVTVANP
jgi:hypothetical protein